MSTGSFFDGLRRFSPAFVILTCALSACRAHTSAGQRYSLEHLDAQTILALSRQARKGISSFEAAVSLHTDGFERAGSFEGLLRYRHPDAVRLRAFRSLGPTVFDFAMVGNEVRLLLPAEAKLVRGSVESFEPKADAVGWTLFAQLFVWTRRPEDGLSPRVLWAKGSRAAIAYEDKGLARRRTTIEMADSPTVVEEEICDSGGVAVVRARFGDYVDSAHLLFPTRVEIEAGRFRILTIMRDARLNLPLTDGDFVIEAPEGYVREEVR